MIITIKPDTDVIVSSECRPDVFIKEDFEMMVLIPPGTNILIESFMFGKVVSEEHSVIHSTKTITTSLKERENTLRDLMLVKDEDLKERYVDSYGNVYSKDKKRLLKGADIASNTLVEECIIVCESAFQEHKKMRTLSLPSVKIIANSAFYACESLERVSVSQALTYIGDMAFMNCHSLSRILFPPELVYVGDSAFNGSGLRRAELPSSLRYLGIAVFNLCRNLTSITLQDGSPLTHIPAYSFAGCNSLTVAYFPNTIRSLGEHAFANCHCIMESSIPKQLESIGDFAFHCCLSLTAVTIPDTVRFLGVAVFAGCNCLCTLKIDAKIKEIPPSFCEGCSMLTKATFQEGLLKIGNNAFSRCNIYELSLPSSVMEIGSYAFEKCSNLMNVNFPPDICRIGASAFAETDLRCVWLPQSLMEISAGAFSSLNSVHFAGRFAVNSGRAVVVNGCLIAIYPDDRDICAIPSMVWAISAHSVSECERVIIPPSVKYIDGGAFDLCEDRIGRISVPKSKKEEYRSMIPKHLWDLVSVYT